MRIPLAAALAAVAFLAFAQESPPPASVAAEVEATVGEGAEETVEVEEPAVEAPAETEQAGAAGETELEEPPIEEAASPDTEASAHAKVDELSAEVDRLGSALEEANAIIDELRSEAWDLKEKARAAEELAASERAAAQAAATAAEAQAKLESEKAGPAEAAPEAGEAAAALAEAQEKAATAEERAAAAEKSAADLRARATELEARIAELETKREATARTLSTWGNLRLDPSAYPEIVLRGFGGAAKRMGSWKIADGVAAQTDGSQYFSRLTFPLVQSEKPTLYSFEVKAGAKGWVGAGIHFFAEGVRKPKGYGEGKSLLVWLTRDAKMRGDKETYLQIYRSDDDVNMERVLDAEIEEGVERWNRVDVLYEPGPEFVVIAVNGNVRTAYRTFFGIGTGVSVSLRTLGEGVAFRNFEVRR